MKGVPPIDAATLREIFDNPEERMHRIVWRARQEAKGKPRG